MHFFSDRLKEIRKSSKLSVSYIVSKLNISRKTYWLWEKGERDPNETNTRLLAKLLNIEVSEISDLKSELPLSKERPEKILTNILSDSDDQYSNILQSLYRLNTQLKQSQTIVNSFLKSIKAALYIKDTKLRYVKVNNYFSEMYDFEENFCYGKTDEAFFSSAEAQENSAEDKKVITDGEAVCNREGLIPGTRKKKSGLISKYPLYDSRSKIIGLVGTFIDVSDLKNAEKRNTLLRNVIDQIKDCILISTSESGDIKLRYVNDSVFELYGCSKEDLFKDPYLYLKTICPEYKKKYDAFLDSKEHPKTIEYKIKRRNDSKELTLRESSYLDGGINFRIIRDITLEKKQQETMDLIRFMLDNFTESLALINLSTKKYVYVNKAREKLYEIKAQDFYNKDITLWLDKCVHPDDKAPIEFLISEAKVDKPLFYKLRIVTPSGEVKYLMQKTTFKEINGQLFALSIDYLADEQKYL